MEEAAAADLWKSHVHPYTELLFSSVGNAHAGITPPTPASAAIHRGELKSATSEIEGCAFVSRCPYAMERCHIEKPQLKAAGEKHFARCWR